MKKKLMKFLSVSLIVLALAGTVIAASNSGDVPGSYGQGQQNTNQIINL